jgi:hypothetical protein
MSVVVIQIPLVFVVVGRKQAIPGLVWGVDSLHVGAVGEGSGEDCDDEGPDGVSCPSLRRRGQTQG